MNESDVATEGPELEVNVVEGQVAADESSDPFGPGLAPHPTEPTEPEWRPTTRQLHPGAVGPATANGRVGGIDMDDLAQPKSVWMQGSYENPHDESDGIPSIAELMAEGPYVAPPRSPFAQVMAIWWSWTAAQYGIRPALLRQLETDPGAVWDDHRAELAEYVSREWWMAMPAVVRPQVWAWLRGAQGRPKLWAQMMETLGHHRRSNVVMVGPDGLPLDYLD